ncbi:hypothetical protein [Pseudomonas chlororaphis]|uniref:hypothetical protein n=2 Tax=Pseudomonas TaxID=286 RepID=UPI0023681C5C|nr:hypothetical protein [Pseudomonas chlororaphis]WDH32678.1 hypothetical protein PUP62_17595 [Pseudomonas chlororaphis]WDH38761.1 hypothetical protein PUP51_17595 [Pseudomonas chlororaphis]
MIIKLRPELVAMGAIKAQVFLPARNAPEQIAIQRFLSVSILDFGTVAGQTVAIGRKLGLAGTEVFGHQSVSVCRWVNPVMTARQAFVPELLAATIICSC